MEVTKKMLGSPIEVANMLQEYQDWRKGVGKYAWSEDPKKRIEEPFTPKQLSNIEDAAIFFLAAFDGMLKEKSERESEGAV